MKNTPEDKTGFDGWVRRHRKTIAITSLTVFVVAAIALVGLKVTETQKMLAKLVWDKDPSVNALRVEASYDSKKETANPPKVNTFGEYQFGRKEGHDNDK